MLTREQAAPRTEDHPRDIKGALGKDARRLRLEDRLRRTRKARDLVLIVLEKLEGIKSEARVLGQAREQLLVSSECLRSM